MTILLAGWGKKEEAFNAKRPKKEEEEHKKGLYDEKSSQLAHRPRKILCSFLLSSVCEKIVFPMALSFSSFRVNFRALAALVVVVIVPRKSRLHATTSLGEELRTSKDDT